MSAEQAGGAPGAGGMSDRMRALLSRAAEEQLLEQRQVSTVLGELRTLLEDVDERLATGEQLGRLAADVREVSARLEARLDEAQARSSELADRVEGATALVGSAAQDLVDAVADRVAARVEAQLRELARTAEAAAAETERRLAVHVDDAVLALAEVVLRRGRPGAPVPAPAPPSGPPDAVADDAALPVPSAPVPDVPAEQVPAVVPPPVEVDRPAPVRPSPAAGGAVAVERQVPDAVVEDRPPDEQPDVPVLPAGDLAPAAAPTDPHLADGPPPDGFVLVPADVPEPVAGPPAPVPDERRTAERRTSGRDDGSGRRRRPWWRPA